MNKISEQEINTLWYQLLKHTVEICGFEFKAEYQTDSFNKLYSDYKVFIQKKNYSHFGLWLFGFYILLCLNSFQERKISDLPFIIQKLIICPILILLLISTKPFLFKYLYQDELYYLQNLIVLLIGIIFPKIQDIEYGLFLEFYIYQTNLECLPFKLLFIIFTQFIQKDNITIIEFVSILILLGLAIYQEIHRYTSYIKDYEFVQKHKKQEEQIIEFILSTQNSDEKEKIYKKLKKQISESQNKKWGVDNLLNFIF